MSGLNKATGNMYPFLNDYPTIDANRGYTFNIIKGMCPHNHENCYCYMNIYKLGALRFDRSELETDLEQGNFIFVGSSCDAWAQEVPKEWIELSLEYMNRYPDNTYLLQSKNTPRFKEFLEQFPPKVVVGTTVESNRLYPQMCHATGMVDRVKALADLQVDRKIITAEPLLEFDMEPMISLIKSVTPEWVNVGADSKDHHMVEPRAYKVKIAIEEMRKFTTVKLKSNLERLLGRRLFIELNK